jgi:hypothetical protein
MEKLNRDAMNSEPFTHQSSNLASQRSGCVQPRSAHIMR